MSAPLRILGVMTGTSCDGLDAACIEIHPTGWKPLWSAHAAYPARLRARTLALQKPGTRQPIETWLKLDRDLGEWYGSVLSSMIRKHSPKPDLIANHGQTLAHFPGQSVTLQLGDPTRIAVKTGISVASQFRTGDLSAGGQGAPLVPLFHRILAQSLFKNRRGDLKTGVSIHNLGGISNLSYIGPDRKLLAFDTGPSNLWIDASAFKASRGKLKFDRNGRMASQGQVDWNAVKSILKHPYFKKSAPKSTGRDDFPFEYFLRRCRAKGASLVATATAITVESIAQAYEHAILDRGLPLSEIFFCGGGAKNPTLLAWIQSRLPEVEIRTLDEEGFDSQLVEAQAFAYFGLLSLLGEPIGGNWTGAKEFGPPGCLTPGKNWDELWRKFSDLG